MNIPKRWRSRWTVGGPYLQLLFWDHVPFVPSLRECDYLFCFVGSTRTHAVRRRLMNLNYPRGYLEDTSADVASGDKNRAFFMMDYQADDKARYGNIISRSKFVLCPRGYACSTWRLFETMKAGRVPVIISDQWVSPEGPAWEAFSLRVREKQIAEIPELLERYEPQAELMGHRARTTWEEWFSRETVFHRIVEWCLKLKGHSHPSRISDFVPYVHLLRPFFLRHVVLPEMKRVALHTLARVA